MADSQPTPIAVLNSIAVRLLERADAITNVTCQDLADDLRLTSGIVEKLARLNSEISEIAARTKNADTASALRATLSSVEPPREDFSRSLGRSDRGREPARMMIWTMRLR